MLRPRECVLAIVILVFVLSGCGNSDSEEKYQSPEKIAQLQSEAIIEHVVNKDKEALKEMFCEHVKNTHDLDAEIETFLDTIDGEIVSYDHPRGYRGGGSIREYEGVVEQLLYGRIDNIKTNEGRVYTIGFDSYEVCNEHPDYVGVCYIRIVDMALRNENYEYPEDAITRIGGISSN